MNDDEIAGHPTEPVGPHHDLRHFLSVLFSEGIEWQERLLLLNRPWEEELLHWDRAGTIHGTLQPPERGGSSVTSTGWCPGDGSEAHRRRAT